MMPDNAYWLLPWVDSGVGIIVSTRHILTIINYPEVFGETATSCQVSFDCHGEQIQSNMEGLARNEVIFRVLRRGFVRIRNNRKKHSQFWSIQAYRLTRSMHGLLWKWAIYISEQAGRDRFCDVVINEIGRDNSKLTTSLDIIASGHFLVEEPGSIVIIRIYAEDQVSLLPRWIDYAGLIDPESLSDDALKEVDGC
jgi:hypothetical protein